MEAINYWGDIMQIRHLSITDNKCLFDFNIYFKTGNNASTTILIGENGTGKSTMIESVLEIFMSFDSPNIEKEINYDYTIEFEYAQKNINIVKETHNYQFVVDGVIFKGSYNRVRRWLKKQRLFPKRIITFYSGANNKLAPAISKMNKEYRKQYRKVMEKFFVVMNDDTTEELPATPVKKFNFCDEHLVPIYLCAILTGHDSYEKRYLTQECHFAAIDRISMVINLDKVEQLYGFERFKDEYPSNLMFVADYIEHNLTDVLRHGWIFAAKGKGYFELTGIEKCGLDSVVILEFFEVLYDLFDAKFEIYVKVGNNTVKASDMSEGQRQLIKVLGMLGICKREDCLILMDEPDAHMNPKWKYGLKQIMDKCLVEATNAQNIIATHDPLVINGVEKEFIRIFTYNKSIVQENGFYTTKVIEPTEDTEGMGIDGLLQSEYYGLATSYDKKATDKFLRRQELYEKLIHKEIDDGEKRELRLLTKELSSMPLSQTSIDFLYDDFIRVFKNTELYKKEYLSYDQLKERRRQIEEIIRALYEEQV